MLEDLEEDYDYDEEYPYKEVGPRATTAAAATTITAPEAKIGELSTKEAVGTNNRSSTERPAEVGRGDDSPVSDDDDNVLQCYDYFDYWTFFGGIFLGVGIAAVAHTCYSFQVHKSKGRANYNEPYRFDDFVNQ